MWIYSRAKLLFLLAVSKIGKKEFKEDYCSSVPYVLPPLLVFPYDERERVIIATHPKSQQRICPNLPHHSFRNDHSSTPILILPPNHYRPKTELCHYRSEWTRRKSRTCTRFCVFIILYNTCVFHTGRFCHVMCRIHTTQECSDYHIQKYIGCMWCIDWILGFWVRLCVFTRFWWWWY